LRALFDADSDPLGTNSFGNRLPYR
jgi:hypothetical protein